MILSKNSRGLILGYSRKPGYSDLLSEVSTVLKLVLVLPATDAQSERIFSSLKNVKTYRRNSMGQARLNHMTMYVHKDEAKKLSLPMSLQLKVTEESKILEIISLLESAHFAGTV